MATRAAPWGVLAATASVYWVAAMVAEAALKPEFDPRVNWISEYGVGPYGWVQNSSFFVAATGIAALVYGLSRFGPASWLRSAGVILLAVMVPGLVISGLFHTDLRGLPESTHGLIHDMSAYANFVGGVSAQILLAASFGDDRRWKPIRGPAIILATLAVVALTLQFLSVQLRFHWSGVINHAFASLLAAWWLVVALRLRSVDIPGTAGAAA